MHRVKLYSRPGCRLCDDARRALEAAVPDVSIDEIDVDSDESLRARYGHDIPVAVAAGRELFRHRFDSACLPLVRGA